MSNTIELTKVSKHYDKFQLNDISFSIPTGTIMGLIGQNGAGKTTLIKLILNLTKRNSGTITIFGRDNIKEEIDVKQDIGVVLDKCNFHEQLKPSDICKILNNAYINWDQDYFDSLAQRLNFPVDKQVKELSKGNKMKLSLITALAHHPKLLILDEPTSGLDPVVRDDILDLFMEFIEDGKRSILFSSHITSDLEKIADYITILQQGKQILTTSKDNLIYHYGIARCTRADFKQIDEQDYLRYRQNEFQTNVLVADKEAFLRKYPNIIVERPTLEDILLFFVKGSVHTD